MTRKFMALSIAVFALLLPSIASVSAAQAEGLDVGSTHAFLTAVQGAVKPIKLTLTSASGVALSTVKCPTNNYEGTVSSSNVTELTGSAIWKNCELGGLEASSDLMDCELVWTWTFPAKTHIKCGPGQGPVTIIQGSCVISIKAQTIPVSVANKGSGATADIEATLAGTGVEWEGSSGCPSNLVGAHSTGDWSGLMTFKAFEDVSGVEGAEVSLQTT